MSENTYAVIMAGGKGERFWPLSTSTCPKQLLSIVGERPLIAQAVERLEGLIPPERVIIITNRELVDATREAAPEVPVENIIGEPMGRDTAAAAALGGALVEKRDPNGVFCILTADHVMGKLDLYRQTLSEAMDLALNEDVLITIGMTPAEPSTGFGYIEAGELKEERSGINFFKAKRFVEKPDQATAEEYVGSGTFFWNSGMFIWSAKSLRAALTAHRPQLTEMMDELLPHIGTPGFDAAFLTAYEKLAKISIDYALMEKADNIIMAQGVFDWDDVGSWTALENHFDADDAGNIAIGSVQTIDAARNLVHSEGGHLTALIGVEDLVVVQKEGVTLVCAKDKAQDIKKMVVQLRESGQFDQLL